MNSYSELFSKMKKEYVGQRYAPYLFRLSRLKRLRQSIFKHREEIYTSLNECLGRSTAETDVLEFLPVIVEINDAIKNLKRWMKSKRSGTPLADYDFTLLREIISSLPGMDFAIPPVEVSRVAAERTYARTSISPFAEAPGDIPDRRCSRVTQGIDWLSLRPGMSYFE